MISEQSNGAFDITFASLGPLWRFGDAAEPPALPDPAVVAAARPRIDYRRIMLVNRHAKRVCSGVFLSGRDPAGILAEDLAQVPSWIAFAVDREGQAVDAWFGGASRQRAVYRPRLGCTLLAGVSERELRAQRTRPRPGSEAAGSPPAPGEIPPWGDDLPPDVSRERAEAVVAAAFDEPAPSRPRRTRAVVVVYRGRVRNHPSDGRPRAVANAWVILPRSQARRPAVAPSAGVRAG